jgi:hypothetical protein
MMSILVPDYFFEGKKRRIWNFHRFARGRSTGPERVPG